VTADWNYLQRREYSRVHSNRMEKSVR
jgi:hypothetical protein